MAGGLFPQGIARIFSKRSRAAGLPALPRALEPPKIPGQPGQACPDTVCEEPRAPLDIEEVLFEYSVGPYSIRIADSGEDLVYVAEIFPRPPRELVQAVGALSEAVLKLAPSRGELDDHYIAGLLRDVHRIPEDLLGMAAYLVKERLRYGKIQVLLDDPYVEDISISGPGPVWIRHRLISETRPEIDMIKTNVSLSVQEILSLQRYMALRGGGHVSRTNPIVDVRLPREDGGHRVHIVDPIVAGERPEISVRKSSQERITMDLLVEKGSLTRDVVEYLKEVVWSRGSIVIAGPPASGKTTLVRAILNSLVPRSWKVVIIEDTPEIEIPHNAPWIRYTTYSLGSINVEQFALAKAALRSSANRLLVVGETRGAEAQVLAQALNMGMGAVTTFHGGSAEEVVTRLTSPPIGMGKHQVASIWSVVMMGISSSDDGRALRRIVEIDEIVMDGDLRLEKIYDHRIPGEPPLERSVRLALRRGARPL